jgi:uncharacterized membrane-anchored protein
MTPEEPVVQTVQRALAAMPVGAPLVVAFSGGIDSTALLHACIQAVSPERVLACHVHHGLQPAADAFAGVDLQTAGDGYVLVGLDEHQRAAFKRLLAADDEFHAATGELKLRYRLRAGMVQFATNAFFFQEGTADAYATARYGEFRVADSGEMILTGLRDEHFNPLGKAAAAP